MAVLGDRLGIIDLFCDKPVRCSLPGLTPPYVSSVVEDASEPDLGRVYDFVSSLAIVPTRDMLKQKTTWMDAIE